VVLSSPARIAIVRLQWAIAWETFEESLRGTPNFTALAQRGSSAGTAQWCVVHSTTGQNDVTWILSAAASALEIQTSGTSPRLPADASLSLVGAEALVYPIPGLPRFPSTDYLTGTWANNALESQVRQRVSMVSIPTIGTVNHDFTQCSGTATDSTPGLSQRYAWAFASGVGGGAYRKMYTLEGSSGQPAPSVSRRASEVSAAWSIRYLTCDSGEDPQAIRGEPGCSNCGDRASLEPWA